MPQAMPRYFKLAPDLPGVCRFGLSTRGNTHLSPDDIQLAVDRGINYLNWCRHEDGMSEAVSRMRPAQREKLVIAFQFYARTACEAESELTRVLSILNTDYIDVATFYYVESMPEWKEIIGPDGALGSLQKAKREGKLRLIGLTTHQRKLGAAWAETGLLDLLMIRYNAAHRGAEKDVFPVTRKLGLPVVVYTCTRWGALLQPTPADPAGFQPPSAPEWYRFALSNPDVSVALMAPNGRRELLENLSILENWDPVDETTLEALRRHGDRIRRHAGSFP